MNKKVIIVGAFHEIIELAEDENLEIYGLIDNFKVGNYRGYNILGNDKDAPEIIKNYPIIITPDKPELRLTLSEYYESLEFKFYTLISSHAKISISSKIGTGTIIQYEVNVSAESEIRNFVKLNTKCNVMHNALIDDYTTIAPNAVILGNVTIGKCCYIGSNSTILPNISICDRVIIGAGSVVTKSINESGVYVGIPARKIK